MAVRTWREGNGDIFNTHGTLWEFRGISGIRCQQVCINQQFGYYFAKQMLISPGRT